MPGQKDGHKDRKTDRPYFIGPFRVLPRVQKVLEAKQIRIEKIEEPNQRE